MDSNEPVSVEVFYRKYWWAAAFIGISAFLDMLDGRLARMIRSESDFGISYDSLSDLVSFGVAPAVLIYSWSLIGSGKLGLMVVLFYVVCTALRLARFNVQSSSVEKYKFTGLPSPMAAGVIASPILFFAEIKLNPSEIVMWSYLFVTPFIGMLMVSDVPYWKFPRNIKRPFNALVMLSIIIAAIITNPEVMILLIAYTYALSGFFLYLYKLVKKEHKLKEHEENQSFRIF
jgi:CDP-diacylglycerol--serine O-phosphatidyltransferase